MTTEQAPEQAQQDQDSGTPAQSVRVPNVSPGAKSGIDHTVIGSDALASTADTPDQEASEGEQDETHDAAWVAAGEDDQTKRDRADQVFAEAQAGGASPEALAELAGELRVAVYGEQPDGDPGDDDQTGDDEGEGAISGSAVGQYATGDPGASSSQEVPGELVESETAGTGASINAETGEVTPPGEPLPTIEQEGGTPLPPADADGS